MTNPAATELVAEPLDRGQRLRVWLGGLQPRRLSLRTRILLMFALGALLLSGFLAAAAYSFTRSSVVNQRDKSGIAQAYRNAQVAQNELSANNPSAQAAMDRLQSLGVATFAINYRGKWSTSSAKYTSDVIPPNLQNRVVGESTPSRMVTTIDGKAVLIIGIPLTVTEASYFEFVALDDASSTLNSVLLALLFAGFITTLAGALLGTVVASRAVRPLGDAAQAAKAIAGGRLDTRLEPTDDPDLRVLANSFNDMASALQARVERDARFASDVSHELRSPLMTLAASVEVMQARRDEMPERAQSALDLLVADVTRFQGLVEDLLEISRFDAGAIRLNLDDLLVAEFVRQAVAVSSVPTTPVQVTERAERVIIRGDRRRLARVVANLIDNARLHGGGGAEISVTEPEGEGEPLGHIWIAVEDHGSGVPLEERDLVFERFARGAVAGRRSTSDGAGLGLALVEEHVRMHGGRVWVEDRLDGEPGARFVLELPADEVGV
ncbi:MAG: HAMP domain-containing sensor histidine kinase [Actinomycetota bacterium]|nr:HAMP domain-containing sensor histidine kinase [Actinomycetota bacterium]